MATPRDVEFRTIDGLLLRGRIFAASGKRNAGIVLCPGFNCVMDMLGVGNAAVAFQKAGITALIYDPRTTGLSEGQPRNDINPSKQVEDSSDALTFLSQQPSVDPRKVGFWGMSFGASVSLCAASVDKRAKFIVAVCPIINLEFFPANRARVMLKCMKDRASQCMGNPPYYIPLVTEDNESLVAVLGEAGIDPDMVATMVEVSRRFGPNVMSRMSVQTYYRMFLWSPSSALWEHIAPMPIQFIVPEDDALSPSGLQIEQFQKFTGPKRMHIEPGVRHEDILLNHDFDRIMKLQVDFIRDSLEGKVECEESKV